MSNQCIFFLAVTTMAQLGCNKKCDEMQASSDTNRCVDSGNEETHPACQGEYSLLGEVESTSLNFTTFAWAELTNGSVLVLGFPDDRENDTDACTLIEQHVEGTFWWHDGAITELRIYGEWQAGGQVEITDNPAQSDSPLTMNLVTSVMDEWNDFALSGSAQLAPVSIGGAISLSEIETVSTTGALSSTALAACYCPSVINFWGVVPPEDTNDTDSDEL